MDNKDLAIKTLTKILDTNAENEINSYFNMLLDEKSTTAFSSHFLLIIEPEDIDIFYSALSSALGLLFENSRIDNPNGITLLSESEFLGNIGCLEEMTKYDALIIQSDQKKDWTENESNAWAGVFEKIDQLTNCPTIFYAISQKEINVLTDINKWEEFFYYKYFNCHIQFRPVWDKEIVRDLFFEKISKSFSDFTLSKEFKGKMEEYIFAIYPQRSVLKNDNFIDDLIKRVKTSYYKKENSDKVFDESCVPFNIQKRNLDTSLNPDYSKKFESPTNNQTSSVNSSSSGESSAIDKKTKNVLVLSLSTFSGNKLTESKFTVEDNDNYEEQSYHYQLEPIPYYLMDTLTDSDSIDEIIVVCSQPTLEKKEKIYEISSEGEKLLQIIKPEDSTSEGISPFDYFCDRIANRSHSNSPVIKKVVEQSSDLETMNLILEELRTLPEDSTIYVDTHGGPRTTQALLNGMLSLLHYEKFSINPDNVFAGDYDTIRKKFIVKKAGQALTILEFVSMISDYMEFGISKNSSPSATTLIGIGQPLLDAISNITKKLQLCDLSDFDLLINNLQTKIEDLKNSNPTDSALFSFISIIENNYKKLLKKGSSVVDEIEWCKEKGYYQQALTLIESKMPEEIIKNGLLNGKCFEKIEGTDTWQLSDVANDAISSKLKDKKQSWKSHENFIVEEFGKNCCKKDGEILNLCDEHLDLENITIIHNISDFIVELDTPKSESDFKMDKKQNYKGYRITEKILIDPDDQKEDMGKTVNTLIQLHMALKEQRNRINHASKKDPIVSTDNLKAAIDKYLALYMKAIGKSK